MKSKVKISSRIGLHFKGSSTYSQQVARNIIIEVGVLLQIAEEARDYLAEAGYDPVFGARPLKRAIQRSLQDPLALLLLDEEVAEGSTVEVTVAEGGAALDFQIRPPSQRTPVAPQKVGEA